MFARRASTLALAFSLLCAVGGTTARPALAGADVCPEPNSDLAAACFLGPGGPAPGFLDTADDVDTYRIELAPDAMIVATLGALPADYGLRLHLPDGSVRAEAVQAGQADKVVRADGLAPGPYFLSVVSLRGASNPDQPYLVRVAYPTSLVLSTPPAPPGALQGAIPYVPAPANAYRLLASDIGSGFREVTSRESEDGRLYTGRIVSPDAVPRDTIWVSLRNVGMIDTTVLILPYGSNDAITAEYNKLLDQWRGRGLNVEPAVGWGSEQVYSYAARVFTTDGRGVMNRGIALKHRNAVVFMEMLGLEQHATWDTLSRLVRVVEGRLHAAVQ